MPDSVKYSCPAWHTLQRELDRWADDGSSATFWWRDDDAVAETPQLHTLDSVSREFNIPVSIAVIPAELDASLPDYLASRPHITVMQHGYSHSSYAAPKVKKIEMGGMRDARDIRRELSEGVDHLRYSFAEQFVPVLVPPWNRIEVRAYPEIAKAGLIGISSMWARKNVYPHDGLLQVNTHMDPVGWRRDNGFLGQYRSLAQLHQQLYARRTGLRDRDEPTGLLTHHLVQNDESWDFCRYLMETLCAHPAIRWVGAREIWKS